MPILRAEPGWYPSDLFDCADGPRANGRAWSILHIRSRQEKALARELRRVEIPHFLPLFQRRRYNRGRLLTSSLPLFPGYLALYADREESLFASTSGRVVRTLRVYDQDQLQSDLNQVARLTATQAEIEPVPGLTPGTRVKITAGPLTGFEGVVLRTAAGRRLVVQVDFLQQGASVLLDEFVLTNAG